MPKQNEVENARRAVNEIEKRRAEVVKRLTQAQERREAAGDDVDQLVELTTEADACRAAIAHLDQRLADARNHLALVLDEEKREEMAELERQIMVWFESVVEALEKVYAGASDGAMLEVVKRHAALTGQLERYGKEYQQDARQLREAIENVLVGTGRYTVTVHGDTTRELRPVDAA